MLKMKKVVLRFLGGVESEHHMHFSQFLKALAMCRVPFFSFKLKVARTLLQNNNNRKTNKQRKTIHDNAK